MLGRGAAAAPSAAEAAPRPLGAVAALPVFYDGAMNAPRLGSPSHTPEKAGLVTASWRATGVPLDVRGFAPVEAADLGAIHEPDHVAGVLSGERRNGFNNTDARVSASALWHCGSYLAAARWAADKRTVALSPSGGFHHAHWRACTDFCTFNGIVLAAKALVDEGLSARPAVVDLDRHWGDGTDELLGRLPELGARVQHYSFSAEALARLGVDGPAAAEKWLGRLEGDLAFLRDRGCDFVLYHPGNDPHVDDPMGGYMTSEQMRRRDALVFRCCREWGLPVAVTLGGGYRRPWDAVLRDWDATLLECWAVFAA
jgi:acetoin utilization deacetylase AcuC-like enzyme